MQNLPDPVGHKGNVPWYQTTPRPASPTTGGSSTGNVTFTSVNDSFLSSNDSKLEPGDQIIVLPAIDTKILQAVKDITQIVYQIAIAANVATD